MTELNPPPTNNDFAAGVPLARFEGGGTVTGLAGDTPVIVTRDGDDFHAFEAVCTHYGAPLSEGAVCSRTVRCPLHHACFSLVTGQAISAPAFDALTRRSVELADGLVRVGPAVTGASSIGPGNASQPSGIRRVVIIGGGAAGFAAADTLRAQGFAGDVVMLSADEALPYDRPNLSKDFLAGTAPAEWMPLKDQSYYEDRSIEIRTETRVTQIDVRSREIETDRHGRLAYDRLLLATGARSRTLGIPGAPPSSLLTLRSMADAGKLIARLETAAKIVLVGSGFIGLETAAALRHRGKSVTVVSREDVPFGRAFGSRIGQYIRRLHEARGVRFIAPASPVSFDGSTMTLDCGEILEADLVIAGIGATPNDALADQAGLPVADGVLVDEFLQTAAPDVFAAGDVARHHNAEIGRPTREEHWVVAQRQGQVAALNMLGARQPYNEAPFFWTHQFDMTLKFSGVAGLQDRMSVSGSIDEGEFVASFFRGDRLTGVASIGRLQESTALHDALNGLYRGNRGTH